MYDAKDRVSPLDELGIRAPHELDGALGEAAQEVLLGEVVLLGADRLDDVRGHERAELRAIVDLHIVRSHYFNVDFNPLFAEPAEHEYFHFSREWMRGHFTRLSDPRNPDFAAGFKINLPPQYMLIHRVWLGGIGVLSQMDATVPMRGELERWMPSFTA